MNTDADKLKAMIDHLDSKYSGSKFLLGVSPLVCDMSNFEPGDPRCERIFPSIFNAYSDHRRFYAVDKCGLPSVVADLVQTYRTRIELAGHGLIHVDHRLLAKSVQELSIIASCNLIGAKTFIPPFNKWNQDTVEVCDESGIRLIKFEDGWRHLGYEKITSNHDNYYFHTHDFKTLEDFKLATDV